MICQSQREVDTMYVNYKDVYKTMNKMVQNNVRRVGRETVTVRNL